MKEETGTSLEPTNKERRKGSISLLLAVSIKSYREEKQCTLGLDYFTMFSFFNYIGAGVSFFEVKYCFQPVNLKKILKLVAIVGERIIYDFKKDSRSYTLW